jgi:hypothetical protein
VSFASIGATMPAWDSASATRSLPPGRVPIGLVDLISLAALVVLGLGVIAVVFPG